MTPDPNDDPYAHLAGAAAETTARIMPGPYATLGRSSGGPLAYANRIAFGDVWNRPQLSVRDRRIVTVAILGLLARDATIRLHVGAAIRHGDLSPDDLSELVSHFAAYAGFPVAAGLNAVVQEQIAAHAEEQGAESVGSTERGKPRAEARMAPERASSEDPYAHLAQRADETFARLMPGVDRTADMSPLDLNRKVVFGDIWNRPHLNVRERRLLTLAVLAIVAPADAVATHVRSALRHGDLGREELDAMITHFSLYAGLPRAEALCGVVQREVDALLTGEAT
jgi:4-carboxymuconolactone decarboxylase